MFLHSKLKKKSINQDNEDESLKPVNFHNLTFDFGSNNNKVEFRPDSLNKNPNHNNSCRNKSRNNSRERTKEFSPNKPTNKSKSRSKEQIKSNTISNPKKFNNTTKDKDFEQENEENDSNYKSLLEKKIKNQAERLYELQKYKDLLERRILQFNPNEIFPVTESKAELDYVVTAHFNESTKFDPNLSQQKSDNNNNSNKIRNKKNLENEVIYGSTNFKDAYASLQKVFYLLLSI